MPDRISVLVCYDVVNDQRRTRLAQRLEAWGERLQKSVFEILVDASQLSVLTDELTGMIDWETDQVTIFPLCAACLHRRQGLGRDARREPMQERLALVI